MSKVVIHLFHDSPADLATGAHLAERIHQRAASEDVDLEVFCFGPAQRALDGTVETPVVIDFNRQIDALIAAGVTVGACQNAAIIAGAVDRLRERGVVLQFARDAFMRFAVEGAAVINF
ncbi:MAG: DsrE family protein [Acidimicrobiales bacterium]